LSLQPLLFDFSFSFVVFLFSFVTLFDVSTELGGGVLSRPSHLLPVCDKALVKCQKQLLESLPEDEKSECKVKDTVHARITGLFIIDSVAFISFMLLCNLNTFSVSTPCVSCFASYSISSQ